MGAKHSPHSLSIFASMHASTDACEFDVSSFVPDFSYRNGNLYQNLTLDSNLQPYFASEYTFQLNLQLFDFVASMHDPDLNVSCFDTKALRMD